MKVFVAYWLSTYEMDTATRVQTLDKVACILEIVNTLDKDMNPTILPPRVNSRADWIFNLSMATCLKEKK